MSNRKKEKRHVPVNHKLAAQFTKQSRKKKYTKILIEKVLPQDVLPPEMNCVEDIIDDFQKNTKKSE